MPRAGTGDATGCAVLRHTRDSVTRERHTGRRTGRPQDRDYPPGRESRDGPEDAPERPDSDAEDVAAALTSTVLERRTRRTRVPVKRSVPEPDIEQDGNRLDAITPGDLLALRIRPTVVRDWNLVDTKLLLAQLRGYFGLDSKIVAAQVE